MNTNVQRKQQVIKNFDSDDTPSLNMNYTMGPPTSNSNSFSNAQTTSFGNSNINKEQVQRLYTKKQNYMSNQSRNNN